MKKMKISVTVAAHARLWAEREREGEMIGYYNLMVAAAAVEHGLPVATFNLRLFPLVKGWQVIEPK